MRINNFMERLEGRFPDGYTDFKKQDIIDYIAEQEYSDTQLDTIDMALRNLHKGYGGSTPKYPTVGQLIDVIDMVYVKSDKEITNDIFYPDKFIKYVTTEEMLDLNAVKKRFAAIERKKFFENKELNTYEVYFLAFFNDLIINGRVREKQGKPDESQREFEVLKSCGTIEQEQVQTDMDLYNKIKNKYKKVPGYKNGKEI